MAKQNDTNKSTSNTFERRLQVLGEVRGWIGIGIAIIVAAITGLKSCEKSSPKSPNDRVWHAHAVVEATSPRVPDVFYLPDVQETPPTDDEVLDVMIPALVQAKKDGLLITDATQPAVQAIRKRWPDMPLKVAKARVTRLRLL